MHIDTNVSRSFSICSCGQEIFMHISSPAYSMTSTFFIHLLSLTLEEKRCLQTRSNDVESSFFSQGATQALTLTQGSRRKKILSTESRNRFRFNACAQTATQRYNGLWRPRNISNENFQVFKTTFWQFFERWFLEKVSFQQNVSERERALDLHQNWGLSGSENILFKQRFLSDLKVDTAVSACSCYMMV